MLAKYRKPVILFGVGTAIGIVLAYLQSIKFQGMDIWVGEEQLCELKYYTVERNSYFWYVFLERVKPLLIISLLSTTWLGVYGVLCALLWFGYSFGMLAASCLILFGIKGIFLMLTIIFPQCFVFAPVTLIWLKYCNEMSFYLYHEKTEEKERGEMLRQKLIQLLILFPFFIVGCLLEGYVNPIILIGFLKIF
ncbi:MAG: stage II sporulation protein M [Lachnospiraceae bacterium]